MILTYATIIVWWVICMAAIQFNFKGTIYAFIIIFVLYVVAVGGLWNRGLKVRDQLIKDYIENKIKENQAEMG